MPPIIRKNWASLLSEEPRIAPDVQFRVTEELSVDGTVSERTELIGAHTFVLSMASDVFKAHFSAQILKERAVVISLTGISIEAFKEFLNLLYSLFISDWKACTINAEYWTEIVNLCTKYKVEDAVSFIENRVMSFNMGEGCIEQEFLAVPKDSVNVEKIQELSDMIKTEEEINDKKVIETDVYCILCQEFGHIICKECVSSAVCLTCGMKGHTRRDCKKVQFDLNKIEKEEIKSTECEEEYVELEIAEDGLKTEEGLESEGEITNVDVQEMIKIHSLKKCEVKLDTVKIKQASSFRNANTIEEKEHKTNGESKIKIIGKNYYCKKCEFKTKYRGCLRKHMQAQHDEVIYPCEHCDFKAKQKRSLLTHIKVEHEGVRYGCEICDYKAKYKNNLVTHIQAQHEGIRYSCDMCDYKIKYKGELMKHIKSVHKGVRYNCEKCDYKADLKKYLDLHIDVEHKGIRYSCEKCGLKVRYKKSLQKHIKEQHEGIRYNCEKCAFSTKFGESLEQHIRAMHEGIRYNCDMCDYKTKEKRCLVVHIEVEHEDIKYSCVKCDYKTKYKGEISRHMKAEHEGVTYDCEKCDYKATRKTNLTIHTLKVHRDTGYICEECDYRAESKRNLSQHMQTVHKGAIDVCETSQN